MLMCLTKDATGNVSLATSSSTTMSRLAPTPPSTRLISVPRSLWPGTKIDDLVQWPTTSSLAALPHHGADGFAGSTRLGDYVMVASQSGVADHLKLGNGAVVGAKSGVMRDIPDGGRVLGIPAAPGLQAKRQMVAIQQLPELLHRMREMEKQIEQLTARCATK